MSKQAPTCSAGHNPGRLVPDLVHGALKGVGGLQQVLIAQVFTCIGTKGANAFLLWLDARRKQSRRVWNVEGRAMLLLEPVQRDGCGVRGLSILLWPGAGGCAGCEAGGGGSESTVPRV